MERILDWGKWKVEVQARVDYEARRRAAMKRAKQGRIVLVTCAKPAEARRIARAVVRGRFAACVNIILSPVDSFYTWKGKLEKTREYLLVMKTTAKRLAELEKEVRRLHSYDVPEFIALPITEGSRKYLSWLDESVMRRRKKRN